MSKSLLIESRKVSESRTAMAPQPPIQCGGSERPPRAASELLGQDPTASVWTFPNCIPRRQLRHSVECAILRDPPARQDRTTMLPQPASQNDSPQTMALAGFELIGKEPIACSWKFPHELFEDSLLRNE